MNREYPEIPMVGVGGVVLRDGQVLLVRRGQEPLKGEWSVPGGMVSVGERLEEAVRRELMEETGLMIEPLSILGVFDRIIRNAGRVQYHYVLVDYLCRAVRGEAKAASDVVEVRWAASDRLAEFKINKETQTLIEKAFREEEKQNL